MLQTGVQMALQSQFGDLVKVVAIDVGVDSQEPLEYRLDQVGELLWERSTNLGWEDVVVIEEVLDPVHEILHVVTSWQGHGLLGRQIAVASGAGFLPQVFVFFSRNHTGTCFGRAELCDGTVKQFDLVVEIDNMHSQPLVDVLVLRKFNRLNQGIIGSQGLLSVRPDILVRGDRLGRQSRGHIHGLVRIPLILVKLQRRLVVEITLRS